jgi:hypothetical protein
MVRIQIIVRLLTLKNWTFGSVGSITIRDGEKSVG